MSKGNPLDWTRRFNWIWADSESATPPATTEPTLSPRALGKAVATSASIGLPIAVAGTLGYIVNGWDAAARPTWSFGYVNIPAFLGIIVASTLSAPLGARLAHKIPPLMLKRIFAVFLVVVGIRMLTN